MKSERIKFPLWLILRIGLRDGWKCHICKLGYQPNDPWEIEHDTAIVKGGKNLLKNLRLAHKNCNLAKGIA